MNNKPKIKRFVVNPDIVYNHEQMKKFYNSLKWTHFNNLTLARMQELDKMATAFRTSIFESIKSTPRVMYRTSELLMHSNKFNFQDNDELIYFYIKVVDSNLKFLELATLAKSKEELKALSMNHFGIYDNVIILMEAKLKIRLEQLREEQITQKIK